MSYGGDYTAALIAGIIGFSITVGVVLLYMKVRGKAEKKETPQD